ncbi:MAG TPA: hypothetical protein VJL58_03735 [Pyrinomonadaceae bacterium]|nr:hypothetical protein [Pyrinomonadaceae bacterium]
MKCKKLLYIGLAVFLLSLVIGFAGTAWSIYDSFGALEEAENAGIGAVGISIERALAFSILSVAGSVIGIGLMIFAGIKMRSRS